MKILFATKYPSPHLFPIPMEWAKRQHQVTIVMDSPTSRFGTIEDFRRPDIAMYHLGYGGSSPSKVTAEPLETREVRRLARSSDRIVLAGYTARSCRTVLSLPRKNRPPTVLLGERPDHRTAYVKRSLRGIYIRIVLKRIDEVWPMSDAGRSFYSRLGGQVAILAPYPMPPRVQLDTRRRSRERGASLRIAVIGRIIPGKRPRDALLAIRHLVEQGVDVAAFFCGTGPLEDQVRKEAEGLPVRFTGHIPKESVSGILLQSDVLLHPAEYDGWGMVVSEAIAHGVGVVASDQCDAAVELAKVCDTVRISELSPRKLAQTTLELSDVLLTRGRVVLEESQLAAEALTGIDSVADRTLESLHSIGCRNC